MAEAAAVKGLLLAGGQSRRMGSDKAVLSRGGETQLEHMMRLLQETTGSAFVSVRDDQAEEPARAGFPQIVDRYQDIGPVAGVLSAMDSDATAAWLVVACDLPNVTRATIDALLAARDPARPFTAFRSSHNELPEPLCAIFEPHARALIEGWLAEGIRCPRKMMIQGEAKLVAQDDPRWLDNINTPADLQTSVLKTAS